MNIPRAAVIFVAGTLLAACSQKSAPEPPGDSEIRDKSGDAGARASTEAEGENALQPREDEIAEDCVAFVRATKVVAQQAAGADCPACPAEGTAVFAFREMKTDRVFCSSGTCEVAVTIRAVFSPAAGERIAGGLAGWIPPDQRNDYLNGNTPSGDQIYRVKSPTSGSVKRGAQSSSIGQIQNDPRAVVRPRVIM